MKNGKYSISDVAEMLGVSKSTVSRAINGNSGVGDELRKKVLDLVDEIGYKPNTIAQSLSRGRVNIVALILGDIRNPFYADLAFNIQRILNSHGYMVMVFNSEYDVQREIEFLKLTIQFNFAGLILITAQTEIVEDMLHSMDVPMVLVNRILPSYTGDSVLTDNFQAGYMAVMHLLELGHKHIGFVRGPGVSSASSQRFEGYRQALRNFSLPFNEEYVYESDLKMETGITLARNFVKDLKVRPSAMVVVNDMTAIGFIDGCRENGLSIPEDLSIVSFDDIEFSAMKGIELTTISQHVDKMSEHAARLMLKQLEEKDAKPERVILEPTLVIRKTTGPCKE
ncbi:LacI family transcriptional regulator [Clostridium sp. AF19-22AC]|jgi:LacI family transcriptional regulator|uniref:LacI family transcriptional regulator n=1 Tax=Faecalicatena orotica TaxID=1544 RepID=A0A2Y9BAH4_9FIRM|nr:MULTISPECIES: LacI family DNA-binding transcriptional regulator [Clostridia]PWJ31309.1 LacI family transcriptional regulator [Faecalicatena orotica]RHR26652.1 LacI family transcriptional regulator [Clostridium sp. AF19-22AC]SSA54515.1 transcriptional regulator, LacI family [Faecalicatena orotica]